MLSLLYCSLPNILYLFHCDSGSNIVKHVQISLPIVFKLIFISSILSHKWKINVKLVKKYLN